jgi:hypothetical protein
MLRALRGSDNQLSSIRQGNRSVWGTLSVAPFPPASIAPPHKLQLRFIARHRVALAPEANDSLYFQARRTDTIVRT